MGDITVIPLVDEGLGNSACLLQLDDGRASAVDVSPDLRAARGIGTAWPQVACVADTHLHADFLTGAVPLARTEERAMGADSPLARAGHHKVTDLDGGPQDWADRSGNALEVGQ